MRRRLVIAAGVAAIAAALAPATAFAHALPQIETPPAGAEVQQAPAIVSIVFGEVPDPQLSAITVINSSGSSITAGSTIAVPGRPVELEVPLRRGLPNGVYTVTWRTVSTVDGHLATGSYAFGVGVSAASANAHAAASVQSPPPSPLQIIGRLLLYAGAMLALGVAAMCIGALRAVPRYARRLVGFSAALVLVGTFGVLEGQREAANLSVARIFATSFGPPVTWRLVAAACVVVTGLVLLLSDSQRVERTALALGGAGATFAMWIDVQYSHAGAQEPLWANLLTQLVHIGAAGVWMGGLVLLVVALRSAAVGERATIARRFSTVFGVCIGLVAITGTFRAVIEIGSFGQLVGSLFGVLVLVKVGLFLILATLGATNRWMHIPQAPRLLHRLRRFASTEVLVGMGVVAVTAALVNVAPPVSGGILSASAQQQPQVTVTGSDFATTVRLSLTVAPGVAGFNTFTARVTDYGTGAAVDASAVVLQLSNPLRPGIASSTLTLRRQSAGVYTARGPELSLDGIWEVSAIVENGLNSTQVDLQLTTDEPPPPVTEAQVPAGGNTVYTVYTIQLSGGRQAQVYLQPLPGTLEFHVTMIAPGGNGEVQTSALSVGETPPGRTSTLLPVRRLDSVGHWVADAQKASGKTRFDIIATLPSGQVLATYLYVPNP